MKSNCVLVLAAGLAVSVPVIAQEENALSDSDSIIVYGVRLEQSVTEVGSSVSILTAEDIEALGVDYVVDAIATLPGVTINRMVRLVAQHR